MNGGLNAEDGAHCRRVGVVAAGGGRQVYEVMEQNYHRIFAFFLENYNYFNKSDTEGGVSREGET